MQSIQLENEKARQDRDNIVALLNGAMALVTQTKEITDKYLETALFKDEWKGRRSWAYSAEKQRALKAINEIVTN